MNCIKPACLWNVRQRPSLDVLVKDASFRSFSRTAVALSEGIVIAENILRYAMTVWNKKTTGSKIAVKLLILNRLAG